MQLTIVFRVLVIFTGILFCQSIFAQVEPTKFFEDKFERNESQELTEEIGLGWFSNSANRAGGYKQVDLNKGVLHIQKKPKGKYAVNLKHALNVKDARIQFNFEFASKKGARFNFYDTQAKDKAISGHVCQVRLDKNKIILVDQMGGKFNVGFNNLDKQAQKKLLAETTASMPYHFVIGQWYEMIIEIQDSQLTAFINGEKIATLESIGINHTNKTEFGFSVVDELKIKDISFWQL